MPRLSTEAAPVVPALSRALWQALGLALLAVALPVLAFGQPLLGPVASFWLPALPALALLTLHRRFLASAWRAHLVRATPRRRQRFGPGNRGQSTISPRHPRVAEQAVENSTLTPISSSRARRGAFARAA
ncbi:hypothetical protein K3217_29365 [bacterium BD-1]|nr:hypothetical protein [Ottowia caeni]